MQHNNGASSPSFREPLPDTFDLFARDSPEISSTGHELEVTPAQHGIRRRSPAEVIVLDNRHSIVR